MSDQRDRTTRRLLACGMLAPGVAAGSFAVAAARRPGYDHVADTISKLSAQGVPERWLWTGGLVAYAALMLLGAAGLRRRFTPSPAGLIVGNAIGMHAVLMIGVAVFRDDLRPGGFFTLEGALHDILSGMAFSALVVAMVATVALANADRAMRSLRTATTIVAAAMTSAGIAFLFTDPEVQGIPQRVFVVLAAVWIVLLALQSMKTSAPGEVTVGDQIRGT